MNKNKKIIISAAAAVLVIVIVLLVFGVKKGWFKKNEASEETSTSVSQITREGSDIVEKEEIYENGELKYSIEKSYADEDGKVLAEEKYVDADNKPQKHLVYAANGKSVQLEEYFDDEGNISNKIERLYSDTEGNVLQQERFLNKDRDRKSVV